MIKKTDKKIVNGRGANRTSFFRKVNAQDNNELISFTNQWN
jgi:hypothetical protein